MISGPKILFLDILTDDGKEREAVHKKVYDGTYSESVRKVFGIDKSSWVEIYAPGGKFPSSTADFDGIVIGGSFHNPVGKTAKPWMKKTFQFIRIAADNGMPILGICGGLQFTVRAFGGDVSLNPQGKEFGTIDIDISSAGAGDKLFHGLSNSFIAQASHKCMASGLKPGWKLLASSDLCRNQAIAIGDNVRLLQFHPEMSRNQLLAYAVYDKLKIPHNQDAEKFGKTIINNFLKYFVAPYHKQKFRV